MIKNQYLIQNKKRESLSFHFHPLDPILLLPFLDIATLNGLVYSTFVYTYIQDVHTYRFKYIEVELYHRHSSSQSKLHKILRGKIFLF